MNDRIETLGKREWAVFWSRVDIPSDAQCWEWQSRKNDKGYGRYAGHMAHRLAWMFFNGAAPADKMLLHHCDNPGCVNPRHLRLGGARENQQDALDRGRASTGERHGKTKLTGDQVREIRASGRVPLGRLATRYGVSKSTVSYIKSGRSWRHI